MNIRINELTKLTLDGKMYATPATMEFDRKDLFLSKQEMESKRLCEFILNQEPVLTKYSKMTGFFNCNASVVGDAFRRMGHKATSEIMAGFYRNPVDNLSTMEWQHATADYTKILNKGISGIIADIDESLIIHDDPEQVEFLLALKHVANALIAWAHKCSERASELSSTVENAEHKSNLKKLSEVLFRVPENAPESFYEAVLCIYLCFSADPDSIGTLDRYLYPFYKKDIENGTLTNEYAYELICKFLITFDLHYDHDMKMVGYADHELENTYVLGVFL